MQIVIGKNKNELKKNLKQLMETVPRKQCLWTVLSLYLLNLYQRDTKSNYNDVTDAEKSQRKDLKASLNYFQKVESITRLVGIGWVSAGKNHKIITCQSSSGSNSDGDGVADYIPGPIQRDTVRAENVL